MITVGKPFWEKNLTLQNLHNVFSNQEDYNTLAMQVLTRALHHNSNSDSDSKKILLALVLQTKLDIMTPPQALLL